MVFASKLKWIAIAGLALLPVSAMADQCDWLSADQAKTALEYVKSGATLLYYGLGSGAKLVTVTDVKTEARTLKSESFTVIKVDGYEIDLADTYLKVDSVYINLSKISECKSTNVAAYLTQNEVDGVLTQSVGPGR